MHLSKRVKILVGVLTAWVVIYPLLFFVVWLIMFGGMMGFSASARSGSNELPPFFVFPFLAIFPIHCISIVLIMGLMVFYVVHIIKNREGSEVMRIICAVGMYFMPYVAMPLYYFTYIWPEIPPEWAIEKKNRGLPQTDAPVSPASPG